MAERIDDLSVNYEEDGQLKVKELQKFVLSRGGWSTIMFLYQEMDKAGAYQPPKVTIRRYQKRNGMFRQQSKFTISSAKQAKDIVKVLEEWFATKDLAEGAEGDSGEAPSDSFSS